MSIQHRPADHPTHSPPEDPTRAAIPSSRIAPPETGSQPALADHIEHTRLRVQVAALERSLVESERRRQAIVDQYELALDAREESAPDESRTDLHGPIARLQRLLPVVG